MDGTGGFSSLSRFKSNPPRCSDCRLVLLVKKLWAEFLPAEFGMLLLVAQEPQVLWTNGGRCRIQRIK